MESQIVDFPISDIQGFFYERKVYDKDRLKELAKDVEQKGVIKNITVAKKLVSYKTKEVIGENVVVAGFRVTNASMVVKRETIPARVYETLNELEATDILLSENIHTEDMSDYDVAQNINRYVVFGFKQKDIATRINKSESYVSQYLQLLKDSEAIQKALVVNEAFTEKHAREVRKLPTKLHKEAVSLVEGKTVRETRDVIKELAEKNKAVVVRQQIKELKDRLKEIDNAEKEKLELERQLAEISGKIKALSPSTKEMKRIVGKIEAIRVGYFPRKERLAELKTKRVGLLKTMPNFDIEPLKKEREQIYGKVAKKTEKAKELKEKLRKIASDIKNDKAEAKRLTEKIELVVSAKNELRRIDTEKKDLEKGLADIKKRYSKEIKDYDKLVSAIQNSEKEVLEKRETLFNEASEVKGKIRSLNGKIANRKLVEKKLENLKKELRNVNA